MSANQDKVLIVDDEKDNLEALQRLLRGQYAVTTTTSPFDALKLVQSTSFNVIISDQRMPEMTGVELLEKSKKLSPQATRILLTGYTDIASVIDAINRGNIYRYVAKPWDPEDFKMTVKQANEAHLLRRELEEKNKELEKAVAELKVLDLAKGRFLSLISHELNTPLTVLNSFVQLLAENKKNLSEDISKAVSSISGASERFTEIIGEVLSYVRLSSDAALSTKETDIGKALEAALKEVKAQFEKKKVKCTISSEKISHAVDTEKFGILASKLLQDALARSPGGGEVKVVASKTPEGLSIKVHRGGEPLSKDAFAPFETASSQMHHTKNIGLMLATCKQVVDSHKGKIGFTVLPDKTNEIWILL